MEETLTLVEKTAFLKSLPAFSAIPTEALAELAARARELHLDAGQTIFREGDPDRGVFLVVEGTIEQRIGRALVRAVRPGMGMGELWLAEGEPHAYGATAIEHTHVLNVTREDIMDAMLDFPEFGTAMVRALALRVHELTGRILELEHLVSRLHAALTAAGIEPPDPRTREADPTETPRP